jgi:hypothetical protein
VPEHSFSDSVKAILADQKAVENQAAMDASSKNIFDQNFRSLNNMRSKYPSLKIVLIPQRDEVGLLGHKNKDTDLVEKYLYSNGIPYSVCPLGITNYMPIDGHPNKSGYQKIFRCIQEIIK